MKVAFIHSIWDSINSDKFRGEENTFTLMGKAFERLGHKVSYLNSAKAVEQKSEIDLAISCNPEMPKIDGYNVYWAMTPMLNIEYNVNVRHKDGFKVFTTFAKTAYMMNIPFLPFASDPEVYKPVSKVPSKYQSYATYIGNFVPEDMRTPATFFHYLHPVKGLGRSLALWGGRWHLFDNFKDDWCGLIGTNDNYLAYGGAKYSLGFHNVAYYYLKGVNERVFNALACGSVHLSDDCRGLEFLERSERGDDLPLVITRGGDDTMRLLKELDNDEKRCQELSERGRKLIKDYHTYDHRVKQMLEVLGL